MIWVLATISGMLEPGNFLTNKTCYDFDRTVLQLSSLTPTLSELGTAQLQLVHFDYRFPDVEIPIKFQSPYHGFPGRRCVNQNDQIYPTHTHSEQIK